MSIYRTDQHAILRAHVIERRLRSGVSSLVLDRDKPERMSDSQWTDSILLVRGVPELTLKLMDVWMCESAGSTWTIDTVEIQGKVRNVPVAQIALTLTLTEAAEQIGLKLTRKQALALHREALSIILDNLVRRAGP